MLAFITTIYHDARSSDYQIRSWINDKNIKISALSLRTVYRVAYICSFIAKFILDTSYHTKVEEGDTSDCWLLPHFAIAK